MNLNEYPTDALKRIFAKRSIDKNGCWLWSGWHNEDGYPMWSIKINGKVRPQRVHRLTYELIVAPIPEKMQLDHLCRVRGCFNPEHLEIVTNRENVTRGIQAQFPLRGPDTCIRGHTEGFRVYSYTFDPFRRVCRACYRDYQRSRNKKKQEQGGMKS